MAALGSIATEAISGKNARAQTGWKITKALESLKATFGNYTLGKNARAQTGWKISKAFNSSAAIFGKYSSGSVAKWGFRPFQKTVDGGQLSFSVKLITGGATVPQASVALYERSSRQLVEVKQTDASGLVIFGDLNKNYKYTAVAIHPNALVTYNAGRQDGMTPT